MKIGFPVEESMGLDSKVCEHFGSASLFVLFDTETEEFDEIKNPNADHSKGQCNPLKAFDGKEVDAVVVGGIGGGAIAKLNSAGVVVYRIGGQTVRDNIKLFLSGGLSSFDPSLACKGHSGGCSHD